jgi:hypothetical protein
VIEIIWPGLERRLKRAGVLGTLLAGVLAFYVYLPAETRLANRAVTQLTEQVQSQLSQQMHAAAPPHKLHRRHHHVRPHRSAVGR